MHGFPDITADQHLSLGGIALGLVVFILIAIGIAVDATLLVLHATRRKRPDEPTVRDRLQAIPWTWQDGAVILLALGALYLSAWAVGKVLVSAGFLSDDKRTESLVAFVATVLFQLTAAISILWLKHAKKMSWRDTFGGTFRDIPRNIRIGVLAYLAIMPFVVVSAFVYAILLEHYGFEVESQEVISIIANSDQPLWLQIGWIISAVVGAPFVEEMLFRGIAIPVAARRYGLIPAVLLVSFAFAMVHAHAASLAPLLVLAIGLSITYLYSGSVMASMVMHSMFNSVVLILLFVYKAFYHGLPFEAGQF